MSGRVPLLLVCLLATSSLAGCIFDSGTPEPQAETDGALVSVQDRVTLPFNVTERWSQTLREPLYDILDVLELHVPVALPAAELGAATTGDAMIHMGVWLPDVPEGTKVPVIADVGPYYSDGDDPANVKESGRLAQFLIENFVPQGYAVAKVSVFGTGLSNHCMDLTGRAEQLGVDAAVSALGSAAWSNGNVGLIGRSYDGTTPWEAAMFGNPALKTIVPISGLTGMHELMWRNGTAEFRGPIMHNLVYGFFGIDSATISPFSALGSQPQNVIQPSGELDADDVDTACGDYLTGPLQGLGAYLTGDHFAPQVNAYWAERYYFDEALANFDGSVYLIHGLQDWNVDPHMAFPYYQRLIDAGLETKGLFGQWAHMYPDRAYEHLTLGSGVGGEAFPATVRYDWAEDLLEWFDHYLKETGPAPSLHAEIQDNQGQWRIEDTFPPQDATWTVLALGDDFELSAGDATITPGEAGLTSDPISSTLYDEARFTFAGFDNETRISGMPRFHVTVTPWAPGGQLFVTLRDKTDDLRLGHATMDLRFHDGGKEMGTVTPRQPIVALMELEPLDVIIPAGNELELVVSHTGRDYIPGTANGPVTIEVSAASVLKLPLIERDGSTSFVPVQYDPCTLESLEERRATNAAGTPNVYERWLSEHCADPAQTDA